MDALTIDHARRMLDEALERIHDGNLLRENINKESDADALLRILGLEILLKCALLITGRGQRGSHDYPKLWNELPAEAQQQVIGAAKVRMAGHSDFSDIEKLLISYQFIFTKARYFYELYEEYPLDEQHKIGELWRAAGAPNDEADVVYFGEELTGLIHGLRSFIESKLPTL
jgi:hypothetical protein